MAWDRISKGRRAARCPRCTGSPRRRTDPGRSPRCSPERCEHAVGLLAGGAGFVAGDRLLEGPRGSGLAEPRECSRTCAVGFGLALAQDGDRDRVLVHVQAEVRSVVHVRSTSVCGHRAVHTARDPRIFKDGPAVSS